MAVGCHAAEGQLCPSPHPWVTASFLVPRVLASFICGLFNFYEDLYFTYLEINPLGISWRRHGREGPCHQPRLRSDLAEAWASRL